LAVLNHSLVGRWTHTFTAQVEIDEARRYADATNDESSLFQTGQLAPPVLAVALAVPPWADAMLRTFEADPYTLGSVHGEQDLLVHRPLVPGMALRMRAAVVGVHPKSTGTLVVGRAEAHDNGGLVAEQYFVNFFRGHSVAAATGEQPPEHKLTGDVKTRAPLARITYPVALDQGVRYAHASGDMGIYHLDDDAARRLGFPRKIVHGVCTMAFAGRAVVAAACDGDPRRLKRLAVRFSAPLLPGQNVTTTLWPLEPIAGRTRVGFEMADESGLLVLTNGLAEVAA
jgi:acyl dehydratase